MLILNAIKKSHVRSFAHLMVIAGTVFFASFPVVLTFAAGLGVDSSNKSPQRQSHQQLIPLAVSAAIFSSHIPASFTTALAALAVVIFGLSSRPLTPIKQTELSNHDRDRSSTEHQSKEDPTRYEPKTSKRMQ